MKCMNEFHLNQVWDDKVPNIQFLYPIKNQKLKTSMFIYIISFEHKRWFFRNFWSISLSCHFNFCKIYRNQTSSCHFKFLQNIYITSKYEKYPAFIHTSSMVYSDVRCDDEVLSDEEFGTYLRAFHYC